MRSRLLFLVVWLISTPGAAEELLELMPIKVSANCYYVQGRAEAVSPENQGFISNAGFAVTKNGVVVFDALATPPLAESLIRAIAKVTPQPIKRVIVSHYHADHFYGLQVFKALGAEIWAHRRGQEYLGSELAQKRLEQQREDLFPWVDDDTRLVPADKWLDGGAKFALGGLHFELYHVGPAHTPEDLAMLVKEDGILFAGDLVFKGRIPFVGQADSRLWLESLDKLLALKPKVLVPGHGPASTEPVQDLTLTRNYLKFLREAMQKAVDNLVPFEEAYAQTDWTPFAKVPVFNRANRMNAYNTYLLLEQEALEVER